MRPLGKREHNPTRCGLGDKRQYSPLTGHKREAYHAEETMSSAIFIPIRARLQAPGRHGRYRIIPREVGWGFRTPGSMRPGTAQARFGAWFRLVLSADVSAERLEGALEIDRRRRREFHAIAGPRVLDAKDFGMQRLSVQAFESCPHRGANGPP